MNADTDWLDDARVWAGLAVVLLHVSAGVVTSGGEYDYSWWIGNVIDSSVRWCVPIFIMLSGCLLLDQSRANESLNAYYKKRVTKIAFPLIFWSVFFTGWAATRQYLKVGHIDPMTLVQNIFDGRPYFHLWYVYMLVGLYLIVPLLRCVIARLSHKEMFALLVATTFCEAACTLIFYAADSSPLQETPFFGFWFIWYLGYFFGGYYLFHCTKKFPLRYLVIAFLIGSGVTAAGYYASQNDNALGVYFYDYLSAPVILMSGAIFLILKQLPSQPKIRKYAPMVFGVYLIHPIFIDTFRFVKLGAEYENPVWSIPLFTILVLSLSILTQQLVRKIPVLRKVV